MKFLNIHSHHLDNQESSVYIVNLDEIEIPTKSPFCLGIHPWFIELQSIKNFERLLQKNHLKDHFFALGEIGLDKKYKNNFDTQSDIFSRQVQLATDYNINILVIHCIDSFQEIYSILKEKKYLGKILFHDFNGNLEIYNQFNKTNETYFSYGASLFTNQKRRDTLKLLPQDRLFLETDDQLKYSIENVYEVAAKTLKTDLDQLLTQLKKNYSQIRKK